MNRIDHCFENKKKNIFVGYLTAGDPDYDTSLKLFLQLVKDGVDILELGVPFSDPLADGAVIQAASDRALLSGMNVSKVISLVKDIRLKSEVPIVLFTYLNPVIQYGVEKFANDAKKAGVDGVLFLDLPPEEADEIKKTLSKNGIYMIFLIAPTSDTKRIAMISQKASGFVYYVSRTGVTGVQKKLDANIEKKVKEIKKIINVPIVVGFGISKIEHVKKISCICDGYVVGSALVSQIGKNISSKKLIKNMSKLVSQLKLN